MSLQFTILCAVAKSQDDNVILLSTNIEWGMFAFLNKDYAKFAILEFGSLTVMLGVSGYTLSLVFFSPLVVSTALLTEPFVAQMFGCLLGVDYKPGPLSYLGAATVLIGVFAVNNASLKRL